MHYNLAGLYRKAGNVEAARRHDQAAAASDYERAATLGRQALEQMNAETNR